MLHPWKPTEPKKKKPKPGKPLTLEELMWMFPHEDAAIKYLKYLFWHFGPVCPYCREFRVKPRKNKPDYFNCVDCRKDFTIRSCTLFERSHIPLHKWMWGIHFVLTEKKGISSISLSEKLGITQRSAWFMLQRIRAACKVEEAAESFILLGANEVEVDETYVGGLEKNKHESKKRRSGRGAVGKTPVFGARSRDGQVFAKVVQSTSKDTLQGLIQKIADPKAKIYTDEHRSYIGLKKHFADHRTVKHKEGQYVVGDVHTNGIESVNAIFKNVYRTYHSYSPKHSQRYIDESVFRLNQRMRDALDRMGSLIIHSRGRRLTYKMLKEGKGDVSEQHPLYRQRMNWKFFWRCTPLEVFNMLPEQFNPFAIRKPSDPEDDAFLYCLRTGKMPSKP